MRSQPAESGDAKEVVEAMGRELETLRAALAERLVQLALAFIFFVAAVLMANQRISSSNIFLRISDLAGEKSLGASPR